MERLELGEILEKEVEFIKSHFEPFNKSTSTSSVLTASSSSKQSHNFDIISQMISNIPTQAPASLFTSRLSNASVICERSVLETTTITMPGNESLMRKRKLDEINEALNDDDEEQGNKTMTSRLRDIQNQSINVRSQQQQHQNQQSGHKKLAVIESNKNHVTFNLATQNNRTVELSQQTQKKTQPSVNNLDFDLEDLENNDCDF